MPVISVINLHAQEDEYKNAPYFTGMPGYLIDYAEDIEFDNYNFFNGTLCSSVEGKKYLRQYILKADAVQASELQIVRNYANAVRSMGGTVFVSGIFQSDDDACSEYDGYQLMVGKFLKDGNEVWIEVFPGKDGINYRLTEVIKEVMKQDIKASGITENVMRDYRKTLPSDQSKEVNNQSTGIIAVQSPQNPTEFATKAELNALKAELDDLKEKLKLFILDVAPDEPVSDSDGNTYNTIRIGTQIWMSENLKTTRFKDGREISYVPYAKGNLWPGLTTPAYCWYNDSASYRNTQIGALYNWFSVNSGYICPTGWHVPTDAEWNTLITYLGGESVAGGKLKETGSSQWQSPNFGATNQSGFKALPSGLRLSGGYTLFRNSRQETIFWSSTEYVQTIVFKTGNISNSDYVWSVTLSYQNGEVGRVTNPKTNKYPVRCLKD